MTNDPIENDLVKASRSQTRLIRFGLLLFVLMPVLGIWWILITKVPVRDFANGWIINSETQQAILPTRDRHFEPSESWEQEVVFDLQTGRLDFKTFRAPDGDFGNVLDVRRRIYSGRGYGKLWQYVASNEGNESLRSVAFPFPELQLLVQNRYAVGADANTIFVCDLEAKQPEVVKSPAGNNLLNVPLFALEGTPHFFRIRSPKLATCAVDVYAIDPDAQARKVATWNCLPNGLASLDSVGQVDGKVVSIDSEGKNIVYHATDGAIVETIPLPAGIDPTTLKWSWRDGLFCMETSVERKFFDLKRKRWLPSLGGRLSLADSSPSGRYLCFVNWFDVELNCKIVDAEAGVIISTFHGKWPSKFLDEQTLFDESAEYGFTFRKVDVQTGKVLQTWQPLRWVPATLFVAIAGYLGWSFAWLKMLPTDRTLGVWCQVFLIAVLPIAAFVIRVRLVGDRLDFSRSPIQFAQAIVLALLLLGTIWLIHAYQRIVVRFLPLLLAVGVMSIAVSVCFSESMEQAVPNAVTSLFPISVFMMASLVARRCGYRLWPPASGRTSRAVDNDEAGETNASIKTSTITITDLLLLMTFLAILFAGVSPWIPSLGGSMDSLLSIRSKLVSFCIVSLMPVLGWWLGFWNPGFKRPLAAMASILVPATLWLMLFVDACYQFFGTTDLMSLLLNGNPPVFLNSVSLRLEIASLLSTYWLALVFRFSGWQWTRSRG